MTTDLQKLTNATRMLAEVSTAQGAKKVMDMASAAKTYAKKAGLGEEAELYAHQIVVDAQTLLGGFLKAAEKNKGAKGTKPITGAKREPVKDLSPTLASSGISKRLSSQSQRLFESKEKDPVVYERARAGKIPVAKVGEAMRERRMSQKERDEQHAADIKKENTRWLESVCLRLNSKASAKSIAAEIALEFGIFTESEEQKLTPERMREAATKLFAVADAWDKSR